MLAYLLPDPFFGDMHISHGMFRILFYISAAHIHTLVACESCLLHIFQLYVIC